MPKHHQCVRHISSSLFFSSRLRSSPSQFTQPLLDGVGSRQLQLCLCLLSKGCPYCVKNLSLLRFFIRKGKPLTGPTVMVPVQARRGNRKYIKYVPHPVRDVVNPVRTPLSIPVSLSFAFAFLQAHLSFSFPTGGVQACVQTCCDMSTALA